MKVLKRKRKRQLIHKRIQYYSVRGRVKGYAAGFGKGCDEGRQLGVNSFHTPFQGTSIIIPTFNQLHVLKECIESIRTHTDVPYELIVVDNASEDGTVEYLQSLVGTLRFRLNSQNLGFAGAINQGLMMAKGTTIVLLNNDTVVSRNWLSNMLNCLNSSPNSGLVGPVTNYIGSNEQLTPTSYRSMAQMHEFAQSYNRVDPSRWTKTDRLTGFCVLMRRDIFRRLGYLDEGFELGNYEDDDYGLRVRLLGLDLMIAKDTFIHHYGSLSIKSLGPQLEQVNDKNAMFYSNKWAGLHGLLQPSSAVQAEPVSMAYLFPTHVLVRGAGSTVYWIEHGVRHPLVFPSELPHTRVSQVDLENWPVGGSVSPDHVLQRIQAPNMGHAGPFMEGMLVKSSDGVTYQSKGDKLYRFVGEWALSAWYMNLRDVTSIPLGEAMRYYHGDLIVAPPILRAGNL
jgi:O-antigen biosynthesis protein